MKQDRHISGMVERLRSFHAANNAERLGEGLLRWAEDPLKPRTEARRFHINPICVLLAALAALSMGTFLFFSLVRP